jgi:3-deoxy-manno-octulosonate cytidylyltransferase (CMP-KDO synthetase)
MNCIAVIPARYESTRLPGKPLQDISGKSMIQRVIEQTYKSSVIEEVVVATDDKRIFNHVSELGYKTVMTSAELTSGTLRCFAALKEIAADFKVMVNVQGDEPFLNPENIDLLCERMLSTDWQIGTLYTGFNDPKNITDANNVKVVVDDSNHALYFSRAVIPNCAIDDNLDVFKRHVGMYAFKRDVISDLSKLPASSLEKLEKLEQLTWLSSGYSIGCQHVDELGMSVDTAADLEQAILFAQNMSD